MSVQAYTNRRRIIAEASNVKVEYKKGVAVNNNAIYASINCLPNFQQITYTPVCKCPFNGRVGPPLPPRIITGIDGGDSRTCVCNVSLWISGGNSITDTNNVIYWFNGGSA
jgi:hypothetical protein